MKSVCSILVLIVALHAQCGVQCLGTGHTASQSPVPAAETPPCHGGAYVPSGTPKENPSHENDSNPCNQGTVVESKATAIGRSMQWSVADLPPLVVTLSRIFATEALRPSFKSRFFSPPPFQPLVLRI